MPFHFAYAALFRSNRTLWLAKTNARSSTVFGNELDSGLFEGGFDFTSVSILLVEFTMQGLKSLDGLQRDVSRLG